jgi:hypothetical protein
MRVVPLVFLLAACAHERDPAPEDMDGVVSWLFRNFEAEDGIAEGMDNLAPWLDTEAGTEAAADGFVLSDLTDLDVLDVPHPDGDLSVMIGVAVPQISPFPIGDHAALLVMTDQIWNDPGTYETYTRTITEGDPDAFAAGTATLIRTVNDIDKKGAFGVHIPYTLFKDYRWVTTADDRQAIVGRSWVEEASCADGGNNCLNQSFSIDLFFESADGQTIRTTASWNDLVTEADAFLSDDQRIGLMVNGMHDIFDNTDEFLGAE